MTDISPDELAYLNHYMEAGLMRKSAPAHIEKKLITKELARYGTGGLVLTDKAIKFLYGKK